MSDLGITIGLNSSQYTAGLNQITAQTNTATQNIGRSIGTVGTAATQSGAAVNAFASNLGSLGQLFTGGAVVLGAQLAAQALTALGQAAVQFGKDSIQAASEVQTINRALSFTAGGADEGAAAYDRFKNTANELGISVEKNQRAFKNFVVSATQSGQTLQQAETEFKQVAIAITAMGLSAEDSNGVLLALGQIASKGTVSAEELRGQIGERLPGAFAIAARSIGVTESELNKMLQKGEVISKDFLPKFTAELEKTFGASAKDAVSGYAATVNKFDNTIYELKTTLGEVLLPTVVDVFSALNGFATEIKDFVNSDAGAAFGRDLVDSFVVMKKSITESVSGLGLLYDAIKKVSGRENTDGLKDFSDAVGFLAKQVEKSLTPFRLLNDLLGTKKPAQSVVGNDMGMGSVVETDVLGKYLQEKEGDFKKLGNTAKKESDKVKKALKEIPQSGSLGDLELQLKAINNTFQNKTGFNVANLLGKKEDIEAQIKRLKELYGIIKDKPEAAAGSVAALQKQLAELNKQISESPKDLGLLVSLEKKALDVEKQLKAAILLVTKADFFAKGLNLGEVGNRAEVSVNLPDAPAASAQTFNNASAITGSEFAIGSFSALTEEITKQADAIGGLDAALRDLSLGYAIANNQSLDFAKKLEETFKSVKEDAFQSLGQGLATVAQTFGNSLGEMVVGIGSFEDVVKNSLKALGQAILVELPKVVGMGLVQSAFSPANIAAFPASAPLMIPLLVAGLALVGASGLIGGALSGIGGGNGENDNSITGQLASANQISAVGSTPQRAIGLGGQSVTQSDNITNVTLILETNGIIDAIQKQEYINNELRGQ